MQGQNHQKIGALLISLLTKCRCSSIWEFRPNTFLRLLPSFRRNTEQKAVYEIACEIKLLLAVPGKVRLYIHNLILGYLILNDIHVSLVCTTLIRAFKCWGYYPAMGLITVGHTSAQTVWTYAHFFVLDNLDIGFHLYSLGKQKCATYKTQHRNVTQSDVVIADMELPGQ